MPFGYSSQILFKCSVRAVLLDLLQCQIMRFRKCTHGSSKVKFPSSSIERNFRVETDASSVRESIGSLRLSIMTPGDQFVAAMKNDNES